MKKLTILEIEAAVGHNCHDLITRIKELSQQMKDYREKIVIYKRKLKSEISQHKLFADDYVDYVSGKCLQDSSLLNFIKIRLGDCEREIFKLRSLIRNYNKKLFELRKQNSELFKKLLDAAVKKATDVANNKSVYQQNKKIVLNYVQARQVFNKLYDLLDSGDDFEKVTIEVG